MITSVFELNDNVGIAYWAQTLVSPSTGVTSRITPDSMHFKNGCSHPLLRTNFCGAFFAIRRSLLNSIRQPDGSTGFWEDLRSYGEEFDTSAECHKRRLLILQLPFFWEHLHSQTFSATPRLRTRTSGLSDYIDHDEYEAFCRRHPRLNGLRTVGRKERWAVAVRMRKPPPIEYPYLASSLAMVFKKWKDEEILGVPAHDFFDGLMRDGGTRTMAEAAARGAVDRTSIKYRLPDGQVREVAWDALLADPSPSFV